MAWYGSKGEPVTRWTAALLGASDSLLPVSREIFLCSCLEPSLWIEAARVVKGRRPVREAHCPRGLPAAKRLSTGDRFQLPERIYRESIGRWGVAIDRARGVVIDRRPGVAMVRGQLRVSTGACSVGQQFGYPLVWRP